MAPPCTSNLEAGSQSKIENFLQRIFAPLSEQSAAVPGSQKKLTLANLDEYIEKALRFDEVMPDVEGRISNDDKVYLDRKLTLGNFLFDHDQLGVTSLSNFSTITANTCVFKGKWVYEVMLGSKGLMQIGWCTTNCQFSPQEGVGDTPHSYAYDGNRTRKWNMSTMKYGESWSTGDVISCAIDCDEGTISFYRNGVDLGIAYDDVALGPGFAYLPAISLSVHETVRLNFGSSPLKYPIDGYRPLQDAPYKELYQASQLSKYLERLLATMSDSASARELDVLQLGDRAEGIKLIIANHIFDKLAPLLGSVYITEAVLLKVLLKFCNTTRHTANQPFIRKIVQLMWMCVEEEELKDAFKNIFLIILTSYRFSTVSSEFKNQLTYLVLLLSLLRHTETRHLALDSVLFDIIQFPAFMHIKPPDDNVLEELIPDVWWDKSVSRNDKNHSQRPSDQKGINEEDEADMQRYYRHCGSLKMRINELEEIQVEILKLLLDDTDATEFIDNKTSRSLFIVKFREFLVTCIKGPKYSASPCPLPVTLCFMHRLVKALRYFWDKNAQKNSVSTFSYDAFVPIWVFTADKRPRAQMQCDRLGGVLAHLRKNISVPEDLRNKEVHPATDELVEILDGVILLYEIASHKQLVKMSELRDNFREMVCALNETNAKLSLCPTSDVEVRKELLNSKNVLQSKVIDNTRHLAWLIAVVFSKEKQEDVHWILKSALRTTEKAVPYENLYSYVPEYYVEVILNSYKSLTRYFTFVTAFEGTQGYISTLNQMAFFLSHNFSDSTIVNTDVRDSIIQSLACFVCYPESLKSLEQMPLHMRKAVIKTLLSPYESRSWPQINWILVRLWKGCGFGYRYDLPPHMSPTKLKHFTQDFDSASFQKPCPSIVFQQHVAEALTYDEDFMLAFVNSVLNQLNWAFSEFLTQLSEIQASSALFDKRKFKLVATCFDLSVGLLRVIELIVAVAPNLFTDASRHNSEILLGRLMQLISQVLCRVTTQNGAFQQVIRKKGLSLDSVDNYPILTAVAGILVRLAFQSTSKGRNVAIMTLLSEATFSVESLEFMIPSLDGGEATGSTPTQIRRFSFLNYKEVSPEEVEQVRKLIHILRTEKRPQSVAIHEDDLCPICYADEISVRFQPCGHTSCRSCIQHQLMNKNECFFCKANVDKFVKITSK